MNSIQELIEDIKLGKMVILIDDEDRENEGDLVLAADFITPEAVNFMACHAKGLICLSLTSNQIEKLGIPMMVGEKANLSPNNTAFTVSIEASTGVTTGISAQDRCHTIRVASDPSSTSKDVIMPGHVFPIKAQKGGVLKRAGHTEASVDLALLAGLKPAAVICEIMNDDGTMARVADLKIFAEKFNLKIGTIEDLIRYRMETESLIEPIDYIDNLELDYGKEFKAFHFKDSVNDSNFIALVKGDISQAESLTVPVRVHTESFLHDVFKKVPYNEQTSLSEVFKFFESEPLGIILYIKNQSTQFLNTVKNSQTYIQRNYGLGAQVLKKLGLKKIKLITSKPVKRVGLKGFGLEIVETICLKETTVDVNTNTKNIKVGNEFEGDL